MIDISIILDKFQSNDNELEFLAIILGIIFMLLTAITTFGNHG